MAIFPKVCLSGEIFASKECCPVPEGYVDKCGGPERGYCNDIVVNIVDSTDGFTGDFERFQWPTTFFNRSCQCLGNFDGPDCSDCKFGWSGKNCTNQTTRIRRNILNMTVEEVEQFKLYLIKAKNTISDYMIPTTLYRNMDDGQQPMFTEISVYDFFTWFHYYSVWDNIVKHSGASPDFAHSGPGFPTWHRSFIQLWEMALQKVSNNEEFALPYWDWAGEPNCTICTDTYFGKSTDSLHNFTVTGTFANWPAICHDFENLTQHGELCSNTRPSLNTPRIQRNPGGNESPELQVLPSKEAVYYALSVTDYDVIPTNYAPVYNNWTHSPCSFRNVLEGYADSENQTGLPRVHQLHNQVHLYFNGTISVIANAPSDPIFILHHVNVDRILEKWLRRYNVTADQFPDTSAPLGHNRYSYIVPTFPVRTHSDFFKKSHNLGYDYDDIDEFGLPLDPIEREKEIMAVNKMKKCRVPNGDSVKK
uniref:Tyrosinase n=1 Tax=Saccoglossus kowalevskii TaxID=10224 RepID=A0ABM0GVT5_SACKO|nr:PREDICTED: tyrosinase-like [Saccoglossus kowalevskii]